MSNTDFLLIIPRVDAITSGSVTESLPASLVDSSLADIRRPLDGMRARDDNYATLSVRVNGKALSINNTSASGGRGTHTANMLVQNVQYQVQEKSQLAHTFDHDRMFFFGSGHGVLNVSAIVIENASFQWLHEFYKNYVDHLSGSKAAEKNAHVEFSYEGKVVSGYMTNMSFQRSATDLHQANVNFGITVTKTTFKHALESTASIPTGQQAVLDTLSSTLSTAQDALNQRVFSDTANTLRAQLAGVLGGVRGLASASSKSVTLREAYPNEYPYTAAGVSIDLAQEAVAMQQIDTLLRGVSQRTIVLESDEARQARIARIVETTALARSYERSPDDFDPSDTFTVYIEPVPIASTPYGDAITRSAVALGFLTASAAATTATEMLSETDFVQDALDTVGGVVSGVSGGIGSALRSTEFGSRMTDKIFGPAAPPSVDKVVFT